jgi:prevent-host-death family protein
MTTDSLRNVRDRLFEFIDHVDREHERVVVTRYRRPAAVLTGPEDLDSLEETLELLGDHDAIRSQRAVGCESGWYFRAVGPRSTARSTPCMPSADAVHDGFPDQLLVRTVRLAPPDGVARGGTRVEG